ncbi:MAG: hypothetical protein OSB21_04810 [Myxococcota bacterium]|jgi:hypothetical protein|nr:hypothetical protein [Myxococcota bacterium]
MRFACIALGLVMTAACGGSELAINGDGDFADAAEQFSGTSFAWWRSGTLQRETGQMEEHKPSLLELRFTGTTMDPNLDYRYESLERRAETAANWARSARLEMSVRSFSDLDGDGQLDELSTGIKYTNRDLEASLRLFVGRAIETDAPVPGATTQAGTKLTFELEFTGLGREHGAVVAGTLNVQVERDPARDPDGVREGQLAFEFEIPVVAERLAQCNETTSFGVDYERFRDWPCEGSAP